jgi:hypothetical protein
MTASQLACAQPAWSADDQASPALFLPTASKFTSTRHFWQNTRQTGANLPSVLHLMKLLRSANSRCIA